MCTWNRLNLFIAILKKKFSTAFDESILSKWLKQKL